MTFTLIDIDTNKHAQSYIMLLVIKDWYLFNIEWDYNKKIEYLYILGKRII